MILSFWLWKANHSEYIIHGKWICLCFIQIYIQNICPPGVEEKGGIDFYKRRIETMFIIKSCLSKTLVVTNFLAEGLSVDCLQDLSLNGSQGLCRTSPMWLTTFPLQPFASLRTLCQSASPTSYKYLVYSSPMLWRMRPGCLTPSCHFSCMQVKNKES